METIGTRDFGVCPTAARTTALQRRVQWPGAWIFVWFSIQHSALWLAPIVHLMPASLELLVPGVLALTVELARGALTNTASVSKGG